MPLPGLRLEAGPRLGQSAASTAIELAAVDLRKLQDLRDLAIAVPERLPQDEHRPLCGDEPFQQYQQRQRHRVALLGRVQGSQCPVRGQHRLRQPRTDVALSLDPSRRQPVQAQVGDHFGQPGRRHRDRRPIRAVPSQKGVLDHVLSFVRRTEQPVGSPNMRGRYAPNSPTAPVATCISVPHGIDPLQRSPSVAFNATAGRQEDQDGDGLICHRHDSRPPSRARLSLHLRQTSASCASAPSATPRWWSSGSRCAGDHHVGPTDPRGLGLLSVRAPPGVAPDFPPTGAAFLVMT